MNFTIVYKTYATDFAWLEYSLKTLKKFTSGFDRILIYCHDTDCKDLLAMLIVWNLESDCDVIPIQYNYCGYIKQMVTKAMCFQDVTTSHVVILDSDVVFTNGVDFRSLINESGKIPWRIIEKHDEPQSVWTVWKKAYEDMTKTPQDVHFMENHFPFVFTAGSLRDAHNKFIELHGLTYEEFCLKRCNQLNLAPDTPTLPHFGTLATVFEEFEWLGFYCRAWSDHYEFYRGEHRSIRNSTKQYWSHGGITPEIKAELNALLKSP
jgi:hypothetical protein